ncbi:MAG TPA: hypothetical protein VJP60_08205 [Rhizomicrobium sp.]|nr:hypothetical protein [Rhizomicrobium sp.]
MSILEKRKARFSILYKADARAAVRGTTPAKLSSLKYHSLDISLSSDFPGGFIVSSSERLLLTFNSHGVLTGWSCRKDYMGP